MFPRALVIAAALALAATAASADQARQRFPDQSSSQVGGVAAPRTAVPRESPPPPPPPASPPPAAAPPRATAPDRPARPSGARVREATPPADQGTARPRQRFPREPQTGVAVPRGSVPPPHANGPSTVYVPTPRVYNNYYYYPRRYYPYGYGSFGLGYFYYDPYTWYPNSYDHYRFQGYGYGYPTGELRLQVRPRHADVFVDGYFAGRVDDFDGMIQALRLEEGPYTIELVAPGFEPLVFNVRIIPGRKITYRGDMRPLRP